MLFKDQLDRSKATCSFHSSLFVAVVPCASALCKVQFFLQTYIFPNEVPFTRGKLLRPLKSDVQGLFIHSFIILYHDIKR